MCGNVEIRNECVGKAWYCSAESMIVTVQQANYLYLVASVVS